MEKLRFSTKINAPKEKVWQTMLNSDSYAKWTEVFAPDSHYSGSWEKGSKIFFLDGKGQGMVSRITDNRPYEFISIEHMGIIQDGKEDTRSEEVKVWAGARENYTLRESGGTTEVIVEMDSAEEFSEMFRGTWPKALNRLKELAEK